jgi:hypothetical protein
LLEVQHKTWEKEHKIVALRKESKLQDIVLQRARTTRNYIIASALMLALLLGVMLSGKKWNCSLGRNGCSSKFATRSKKLVGDHEPAQFPSGIPSRLGSAGGHP